MQFKILILDDEPIVCNSMKRILENEERVIITANTVEKAEQVLKSTEIDLLLLDYKLGSENGINVLKKLRELYPDLMVIMITAYGNIDIAVEAMKLGAYDFLQKKADPQFLRHTIQRTLDTLRLRKEVEELKSAFINGKKAPQIVQQSAMMKRIMQLAVEYAKSDSIVLIEGETGTGKSMIADFIHQHSERFDKPFVTINCSAIPSELIESELFGYEKGAFTGAHQQGKKGLVEQASGGTLFLDEIGELSLEMQSKLLHILEKNQLMRVGAVSPVEIDVRFIAATNADLLKRVEEKKFRMDLYYRLNVAHLVIPPLRERIEDIISLAMIFVDHFNRKFNKSVRDIDTKVSDYLKASCWMGNVRELRNSIERAMLLKQGPVLTMEDFTERIFHGDRKVNEMNIQLSLEPEANQNLLHGIQKKLILHALEISGHNITKSAEFLGIPRTSLASCMERFGIRK